MVAWMHAIVLQAFLPPAFHQNDPRLVDVLTAGVDIFFVLSGFIISHSASRYSGRRQSLNFLRKRFFRINPVYYVALILFLAVRWHWMVKTGHTPGTVSILKSIILLPVVSQTTLPIMPVAWTLCFEWVFYLLFAITIAFRSVNRPWLLPALGVIFYIIHPIMLEFLLGMAIYRWWSWRPPSTALAAGLALTGILLLVSQCFWGNIIVGDPSTLTTAGLSLERGLFRGIPAAFLLSGCVFLENKNALHSLWNNKTIEGLGDASYSIYLTHYTVYMVCAGIMVRLGPIIDPDFSVVIWLLFAISTGILFYRTVETSLLRVFR